MLQDVLKTFLSSLSEREFDAPLLALLRARDFDRVHFIHGSYEFGKDVIAQALDPSTNERKQYVIQSKAGDIGLSAWRDVRPQLEEAGYGTRAHPEFDATLPRVVVLATTGRLKGQAPIDAQDFEAHLLSAYHAEFETWDEEDFVSWLATDPRLGLAGTDAHPLDAAVAAVRSRSLAESDLERFTRRWTAIDAHGIHLGTSAVEAAVLASQMKDLHRLDLAALTALHLLRASWSHVIVQETTADTDRPEMGTFALRLFGHYVDRLLSQVEPLLTTAKDLAAEIFDEMAIVTYPAILGRIAELFGLAGLLTDAELGVDGLSARARSAVVTLVRDHPGAARPVSDKFAVSLIPPPLIAIQSDPAEVRSYLRKIATWLLDRHNPDKASLGLGTIDEPEQIVVERLLGGYLESTVVDLRYSSFVATVLLDLLLVAGEQELYESLGRNLAALRVIPSLTAADESKAHWHRGGPDVWPQVRVDYPPSPPEVSPTDSFVSPHIPRVDAVAMSLVCRTRYDTAALQSLAS